VPSIGERLQIDFPRLSVPDEPSRRYVVADIDDNGNVTARPIGGCPPSARTGTPCTVQYHAGAEPRRVAAILVSCGPGGVVMQLHAGDQRRFPRYHRRVAMTIEVPQTNLGVIDGVTEDVSVGGLRARIPVALPADQHAFISLDLAGSDPILAAARTLSCAPIGARASHIVRVQFTILSAQDQARLFALLEWPIMEPITAGLSHAPLASARAFGSARWPPGNHHDGG
jgi:hypothetical protein